MLRLCLEQRKYERVSEHVWRTPTDEIVWVATCSPKDVVATITRAKKSAVDRCIVVVRDTEIPKKNLDEDTYVGFFAENEPCMIVPIYKNARVKNHTVVDSCPFVKTHLPKINADDVMVRWIGAKIGDVVRVGDGSWFEVV